MTGDQHGRKNLPRVAGEVLSDKTALRSHLSFSHGEYVETTLTLKEMRHIHMAEHEVPGNGYTEHRHDPPRDAGGFSISADFSGW